jgi:DNA polymerase-3 subunit delta'
VTARPEPSATPALVAPLGQGEPLLRLLIAARRRRLHHAILVEGARGGGKTTVAQWLAAALLCPSELDREGPCGVCRTCRRVASNQHPDLHWLERAKDADDAKEWDTSRYVIRVKQVRLCQETLARHAVEGGARVLIVEGADWLNEEAQNALLKTLEEPGADTFLLLTAVRPEALLPTVRSRVERLRLLPLPAAHLQKLLAVRLPERKQYFARAIAHAGGSLGMALELCTERAVQMQDLVQAMLASTKGLRPMTTARAVLDGAVDRAAAVQQARAFLLLLRAELALRTRGHLEAAAASPYAAASSRPWTDCLESAVLAERDLDLQIPPEQALTGCFLCLQEAMRA